MLSSYSYAPTEALFQHDPGPEASGVVHMGTRPPYGVVNTDGSVTVTFPAKSVVTMTYWYVVWDASPESVIEWVVFTSTSDTGVPETYGSVMGAEVSRITMGEVE